MEKKISISACGILFVFLILLIGVGVVAFVRSEEMRKEGTLVKSSVHGIYADRSVPDMTPLPGREERKLSVSLFFHNAQKSNDPDMLDCGKVFPVVREISAVPDIAQKTLGELLKGPTSEEMSEGYTSAIQNSSLISVERIVIQNNGQAIVDLSHAPTAGGSCALLAATSEIRNTLLQFPAIQSVQILVNGSTEWAENP